LATLLGGLDIDPDTSQASQVVATSIGIHHMNRFVAALEAIPDKWKEDAILFVVAVEEGAHMTHAVELRTRKGDWGRDLFHDWLLPLSAAARSIFLRPRERGKADIFAAVLTR